MNRNVPRGDTYFTAGDSVAGSKITQFGDHNVGLHAGDSQIQPAAEELRAFLDFLIYIGAIDSAGVVDQQELEDQLTHRGGRLGRVMEALKSGGIQALEAAVRHVAVPAVLETIDRQMT